LITFPFAWYAGKKGRSGSRAREERGRGGKYQSRFTPAAADTKGGKKKARRLPACEKGGKKKVTELSLPGPMRRKRKSEKTPPRSPRKKKKEKKISQLPMRARAPKLWKPNLAPVPGGEGRGGKQKKKGLGQIRCPGDSQSHKIPGGGKKKKKKKTKGGVPC